MEDGGDVAWKRWNSWRRAADGRVEMRKSWMKGAARKRSARAPQPQGVSVPSFSTG